MSTSPLLLPVVITLFGPAFAALVIALVPGLRRSGWYAAGLSVFAALAATAAAVYAFAITEAGAPWVLTAPWIMEGGRELLSVGFRVDGVSSVMLMIVTGVAACVQVFSLGYMSHEPRPALGRYFLYHSLFIFSMNLLVLAPDLFQFFAGWELVGLTSYLLIGFYYQKPSAAHAAVKAFWFTKLADMGFLGGLLVLFVSTGGLAFEPTSALSSAAAVAVTLLLFLAVMGKSAQFPLHVWLPNAMEGPTPVSALLHAATMVAAGVYLLVRASPLFAVAPLTLHAMLWVGAVTALFAATLAVFQTDLKRVLAYSTCSQLGFMVAALGSGHVLAGYFHLATHACFKALLFLAAGSVIHAVHTNEMPRMGGLAKRMPLTAATFAVGAFALAGVPGFSGFFSKDLILEALLEQGAYGPLALLFTAAALTAFYMGRALCLTFLGAPSAEAEHAHESGAVLLGPLLVLSVGALALGFLGHAFAERIGAAYHFHFGTASAAATVLGIGGLVGAYAVFRPGGRGEAALGFLAPLKSVVAYGALDRGYRVVFSRGAVPMARIVAWFDRYVIDGVMNALAWLAITASRFLLRMQTGNVLHYVFAVATGVAVLVAWGCFQ
jgi:NADH-quinone oxidoreductase subunit L